MNFFGEVGDGYSGTPGCLASSASGEQSRGVVPWLSASPAFSAIK